MLAGTRRLPQRLRAISNFFGITDSQNVKILKNFDIIFFPHLTYKILFFRFLSWCWKALSEREPSISEAAYSTNEQLNFLWLCPKDRSLEFQITTLLCGNSLNVKRFLTYMHTKYITIIRLTIHNSFIAFLYDIFTLFPFIQMLYKVNYFFLLLIKMNINFQMWKGK